MKRAIAYILLVCLCILACTGAAAAALKKGAKGEEVAEVQRQLIKLGLLSGSADGIYGDGTERAVNRFQRWLKDNGYADTPADGIVGDKTRAFLYDKEILEDIMTLEKGERGEDVSALQGRLYDLNFLEEDPDGVFGDVTEAAVRAFQQLMVDRGLKQTATGIADPDTRSTLNGDLSLWGIAAPMFFDEENPLALTREYLYARSCILMDADTGEVLFEKEADKKMYPASTTKVMTAMIALNKLKLNQQVTIPKEAANVPSDSSLVPLTPGEQMSVRDLITSLMLRSGNDAANALAVLCSGSVEKFSALMNHHAGRLGMANTNFTNPHGYHSAEHYTTARDMARLVMESLRSQAFVDIITTRSYTMAATAKRKELTIKNNYGILDASSKYYVPGAFGIKTGYTGRAGYCYVGAARKDGRTLILVLFKSGRESTCKWVDARRLYAYGFAQTALSNAA
jgi:D-alanyl-D-alanine carboxypeptidase